MRVLAVLALLVGLVSGSSTYMLSQQSGQSMSPLTDLPISAANAQLVGPFQTLANLQTKADPSAYAATWQLPIDLPFAFPFFGQSYTSITLSSKGYIYMGSYPMANEPAGQFASAATAPDYSNGGAGFPHHRALLSFFHNQDGAVAMTDLELVNQQWFINGFVTQVADAVNSTIKSVTSHSGSTTTTLTTEVSTPPPNSISGSEDGRRFILSTDNTDAQGVMVQLAVVLHESGLIEVHYYTIQPSDNNPYLASVSEGQVSIGVQNANGFFVSANRLSRRSFADLNEDLLESVISFTPVQSTVDDNEL
jgi:hypothetical protein